MAGNFFSQTKELIWIMEHIGITSEFIRLDAALKLGGVCPTGGEAKLLIQRGAVRVNGEICTMRGKKLRPGDRFEIRGREIEVRQA